MCRFLRYISLNCGPLLQRAQLLKTDALPAVYAEWLHAGKDAPTVLIYGHYGESSANISSKGTPTPVCCAKLLLVQQPTPAVYLMQL